jgi:hypothetical protein
MYAIFCYCARKPKSPAIPGGFGDAGQLGLLERPHWDGFAQESRRPSLLANDVVE